ncbi:unnamed protein product, partial [Pylaiella littoralis]
PTSSPHQSRPHSTASPAGITAGDPEKDAETETRRKEAPQAPWTPPQSPPSTSTHSTAHPKRASKCLLRRFPPPPLLPLLPVLLRLPPRKPPP